MRSLCELTRAAEAPGGPRWQAQAYLARAHGLRGDRDAADEIARHELDDGRLVIDDEDPERLVLHARSVPPEPQGPGGPTLAAATKPSAGRALSSRGRSGLGFGLVAVAAATHLAAERPGTVGGGPLDHGLGQGRG